jgi:hypothetical protein
VGGGSVASETMGEGKEVWEESEKERREREEYETFMTEEAAKAAREEVRVAPSKPISAQPRLCDAGA